MILSPGLRLASLEIAGSCLPTAEVEHQHWDRSTLNLRELTAKAIASQRLCFLVSDGLDECSEEDLRPARHDSQREIIDRLEALMAPEVAITPGSDSEGRRIHLLMCGQRNGFLE